MMWEIMGEIFYGDPRRLIDPDRRAFRQQDIEALLQTRGIALYDAATAVIRLQGNASDKHLQIVQPTDLPALLERLPCCRHIACTGQKAAEIICHDHGIPLPGVGESLPLAIGPREMHLHRMPSTSRAYPLPLKAKADHYRRMMQQIGIL